MIVSTIFYFRCNYVISNCFITRMYVYIRFYGVSLFCSAKYNFVTVVGHVTARIGHVLHAMRVKVCQFTKIRKRNGVENVSGEKKKKRFVTFFIRSRVRNIRYVFIRNYIYIRARLYDDGNFIFLICALLNKRVFFFISLIYPLFAGCASLSFRYVFRAIKTDLLTRKSDLVAITIIITKYNVND